MAVSYEVEQKLALSQQILSYLPQRSENICLQEALHKNVQSNFIYYSQSLEKIQMLAREMTNRLLFIHIMEYVSAIEGNKPLMNREDIW